MLRRAGLATTAASLSFPLSLPSYDVVNLRVGVRGDGWEAAAFVNNLGDERARLAVDRERGLRAHVSVTDETDYAASFVVVETRENR